MAEPRKITIKLRSVGAKPAIGVKPATAPAASAPTPAAEPPAPPPAPAPETPPATTVPTPSAATIPPPPVEASAPEAKGAGLPSAVQAPPAAPEAKPATPSAPSATAEQAKRQTSRIELPPEITQQPMAGGDAEPTIKLKPISQTAKPAEENPQAAKSKTARIALDSVLGGIQADAPLSNTTQKTIKIKRPSESAAPKPTLSKPMTPVGEATPPSEQKTIKAVKRPSLSLNKTPPKKPEAASDDGMESLEELEDLSSIPEMPALPAQESAGAKAFTIVGIVAAAIGLILTIVTCIVMQKQAAKPYEGAENTPNTLHSLPFSRF